MSLKEWKNNELNMLLLEKWGYKPRNEEQQIFAPNHYCAHHVRENISGLEGHCVDHNWNERLQEVTAYEVDFGDNDIRTLRVEDLTILEASLPEGHAGHSARKEDHEENSTCGEASDAGLGKCLGHGGDEEETGNGEERRRHHVPRPQYVVTDRAHPEGPRTPHIFSVTSETQRRLVARF